MEHAIRLRVMVGDDHTIRLPDEVPVGEAEVIVLVAASAEIDRARRIAARKQLFGALLGQVTITDDFDAPLPEDILGDFEGGRKA